LRTTKTVNQPLRAGDAALKIDCFKPFEKFPILRVARRIEKRVTRSAFRIRNFLPVLVLLSRRPVA
jgi:hypothetical protein